MYKKLFTFTFGWIKWFLSFIPAFKYEHVPKLDSTIKNFNSNFMKSFDTNEDKARRSAYQKTTEVFYNLITDFYEWGWGKSFHFAPRYNDETFRESIVRYEYLFASSLGIPTDKESLAKKEYQILDVGCGVGGPLRAIARFFKFRVHVTGINITKEHINRAEKYNKQAGVRNYTLVHGDFNQIPRADGFFDAVYDFEATLHSTDRQKTFKEICRVLKPGGRFVTAQYCLLDNYDPNNKYHLELIRKIDNANGCYCFGQTVKLTTSNLEKAGFKVISHEDVFAEGNGSDIRFHECFEGAKGAQFTGTSIGLRCTYAFTYIGESLRLLPRGTCEVQGLLMDAAESFKEAGKLGLISPGLLYICEKPLSKKD